MSEESGSVIQHLPMVVRLYPFQVLAWFLMGSALLAIWAMYPELFNETLRALGNYVG